ncbi:MAG: hypothetical protein RML47_04925 [Bacteroidota bacterium]|nr:hypothetical protein [Rhodothermia bacterium]MCS7154820.1 hypothetical protein [Bacteroidota bacterium]MDW8137614.1 hypothetical protein [Bacteroidota bacterium]MDW8285432.1 hypothetical protein [Bacteroidota bacterium]
MRDRFSRHRIRPSAPVSLLAVLNVLLVLLVLWASLAPLEDLRAVEVWWPAAEESTVADPPLGPTNAPALRIWLTPDTVYLFDPLRGNRIVEQMPLQGLDAPHWPRLLQAVQQWLHHPPRPEGLIQLVAHPAISHQMLVEALRVLQRLPEPWSRRVSLALVVE